MARNKKAKRRTTDADDSAIWHAAPGGPCTFRHMWERFPTHCDALCCSLDKKDDEDADEGCSQCPVCLEQARFLAYMRRQRDVEAMATMLVLPGSSIGVPALVTRARALHSFGAVIGGMGDVVTCKVASELPVCPDGTPLHIYGCFLEYVVHHNVASRHGLPRTDFHADGIALSFRQAAPDFNPFTMVPTEGGWAIGHPERFISARFVPAYGVFQRCADTFGILDDVFDTSLARFAAEFESTTSVSVPASPLMTRGAFDGLAAFLGTLPLDRAVELAPSLMDTWLGVGGRPDIVCGRTMIDIHTREAEPTLHDWQELVVLAALYTRVRFQPLDTLIIYCPLQGTTHTLGITAGDTSAVCEWMRKRVRFPERPPPPPPPSLLPSFAAVWGRVEDGVD